jgi:hypothetical protein
MTVPRQRRCNCFSYNGQTGTVAQRLMDPRPYFQPSWPAEVAVDECIANEVLALWIAGIWTLNSCCGHSGSKRRAIVIEDGGLHALRARTLVARDTAILFWSLCEFDVTDPERPWQLPPAQVINHINNLPLTRQSVIQLLKQLEANLHVTETR